MLKEILKGYEGDLLRLVKFKLTQNQFDALASFTFNLGGANLSKSRLLKKFDINPSDPNTREEFAKWNKAGGKGFAGLRRITKAEADLYFSK